MAPRIGIDVSAPGGRHAVKSEIPGARQQDIGLPVVGSVVTIGAAVTREHEAKEGSGGLRQERQQGCAGRSFTLASPVGDARAGASCPDGTLASILPTRAATSSTRPAIP